MTSRSSWRRGSVLVEKLRTYLEMTAPEQLRPYRGMADLEIVRVSDPAGADMKRVRALHEMVATPHHWPSLDDPKERWRCASASAQRSTFIATVSGDDVGWASLACSAEGEVRIAQFGIVPDMVGRGYGGAFLTEVVRRAWQLASSGGTGRVWLRTSSWDHPHALSNYLARGFRVVRLELQEQVAGVGGRQAMTVTSPPPFLVRPAVANDAEAVAVLIAELGYALPVDTCRRRLAQFAASRDEVVAVGVEHPDRIVGFISASLIPLFAEDEPGFVRITAVSVSRSAARHGVGRKLVGFVEYVAAQRQLRLVEVSSGRRPERAAAHRFYSALGFSDAASRSVRYWKRLGATSDDQ